MGISPRLAMSKNVDVRVCSILLMLPSLVSTSTRTMGFSCSKSSKNSRSVLLTAGMNLLCFVLHFVGGSTPSVRSNAQNLAELRKLASRLLLSANPSLWRMRSSMSAFSLSKRSAYASSNSVSRSMTGCVHILVVMSAMINSLVGTLSNMCM